MNEQKTTGKKLSSTQIILIVGLVAILAAIGVVGMMLLNRPAPVAPSTAAVAAPGTGNLVVDEGFDPDAMRQKAADNMFEVKMNTIWNFPDGASPSNDAYVANSTANRQPFYFEVALLDTEDVLYTSPVIPLGSAVREFALDTPLAAGNHKAVCNYRLLNPDDTIATTVSVAVELRVG